MVTRRCNMTCGHCSVESGPDVRGEPSEALLVDWIRQAAAAGVRAVRLTGGEPMLRADLVVRLVRECRRRGLASAITTNGFWGRRPATARRLVRGLRRAGLGAMTVSYDRYHADFQGPGPLLNIVRAAEAIGFPVNVNVVRGADDPELATMVAPFRDRLNTRLRFYDIQPVGRARKLPAETWRQEIEGSCAACHFPAITDDGRLIACNGPAYFERPPSPLHVGSLREAPLAALLERHRRDPILETIRTFGPARLRDELRATPGFEAFPFRERYLGICDLCHHITSQPAAVAALRERLARPEKEAERLAARRVIDAARRSGPFHPRYVNGIGACRVFLRAAWEPTERWTPEAEQILGRADLDWHRLGVFLAGSGLARPLLPVLDDAQLTRWAPRFFGEQLRDRALRDGINDLVQREAVRRVAEVLEGIGLRGVLLKGAALAHLPVDRPVRRVCRSGGDLDVWVEPAGAPRLRATLLAHGFTGPADATGMAPQHLAPIAFQGLSVEIHTRVMPAFWGLPEREMLVRARPVPGLPALRVLDAEGLILHAGTHATAHFFSFGLKTAWDLLWVLETHDAIDWNRLATWVRASRLPRGFWVPIRVLSHALGLPVPDEFLQQAPLDAQERRMETVARYRLFHGIEGLFDLDPLTKNGLLLLLHDSWIARLRFVASQARWRGVRSTRWVRPLARAGRPGALRAARWRWRQYRRAIAAEVTEAADP